MSCSGKYFLGAFVSLQDWKNGEKGERGERQATNQRPQKKGADREPRSRENKEG
ncbi:hypothetical protein BJX99DRAFT_218022 [Aspergillus californicus]